MSDNRYKLRGWFTHQNKETIKIIKKAINFTTRENTTEEDLADAFNLFVENNSLMEDNVRGVEGSEEWIINYFSCFWTYASMPGDWCADDFGWVVSDSCEMLRSMYGYD